MLLNMLKMSTSVVIAMTFQLHHSFFHAEHVYFTDMFKEWPRYDVNKLNKHALELWWAWLYKRGGLWWE